MNPRPASINPQGDYRGTLHRPIEWIPLRDIEPRPYPLRHGEIDAVGVRGRLPQPHPECGTPSQMETSLL